MPTWYDVPISPRWNDPFDTQNQTATEASLNRLQGGQLGQQQEQWRGAPVPPEAIAQWQAEYDAMIINAWHRVGEKIAKRGKSFKLYLWIA